MGGGGEREREIAVGLHSGSRFKLEKTKCPGDEPLVQFDLSRKNAVFDVTVPSQRNLAVTVNNLINGCPTEARIDSAAMITLI